ncbi:insulinase family protein [bacterium]|nr:insulinase family protein [bacterium]
MNLPLSNVQKYTLSNGLTVLLEHNASSPVVSVNMGVKVGSSFETNEEAGLSHLLEHMVFKGTKSTVAGEIAQTVEACGGELNAYTSFDQTVYYINLTSQYLSTALHLIKEMVLEATIDPTELEREKEVVIEEIRRGLDSPNRVLSQMAFSQAFKVHPYGRPVIGFEQNVRGFPQQVVFGYYKKWYAPNNMVLGICGDFNEKELKESIQNMFGSYTSHPIPEPVLPPEPLPSAYRFTQTKASFQGNYLSITYPIPNCAHPDIPALDLLAQLLGEGDTSTLVHELRDKRQLVNSIGSYAYSPRSAGIFGIDTMMPDQSLDKVLPEILALVEKVKTDLYPVAHLKRVKTNMLSSLIYEKETCEGTARKWMVYETTVNDYRFELEYLEKIKNVTVHDIKHVAEKYLKPQHVSVCVMSQQDKKVNFPKKFTPNKKSLKPYKLLEKRGDISRFALQNGITVVVRENKRLPLVSIKCNALGGLRYENKANNGITHLTTALLEKGTKNRSSIQISKLCEQISGHVSGHAGRNSWGISAGFLSEHFDKGIDLFCDVLKNPVFDENEFKKEKRLVLESIKNQADSPSQLAFMQFQASLFKKHPYGMPLIGTNKTVNSFKSKQMAAYYQKMLKIAPLVIACSGDVDAVHFVEALCDELLALKKVSSASLKLTTDKAPKTEQKLHLKKDKNQSHVVLGFMGPRMKSPDRYALEVLNNILSGQGGRLFLELRDKRSMAYTVSSMMVQGMEPGYFATYIGTEPSKVEAAVLGMREELQKIQDEKVSDAELKRAINYIIGNHELDMQRNATVASSLALNEVYCFGLDEFENYAQYVSRVTTADVQQAAQKYLNLKAATLSIVGP